MLMTTPRHIAPGAPAPVSLAPGISPPSQNSVAVNPPENAPPVIGANDIIFVDGQAFNGRGYPVCGVANQRGRLCGRIGSCPFHAKKNGASKRPRAAVASTDPSNPSEGTSDKAPDGTSSQKDESSPNGTAANIAKPGGTPRPMHPAIRQMAIPPRRSRFKRSWTTDEHRRFLQAMRRHGKGKWKEIAVEVKTRNANQCQSHAQKYFLRQAKSDSERKKKSIHDVTEADMSKETTSNTANALVWSPSPMQAIAQSVPSTTASTQHASGVQPGLVATPIASRPTTSGVPLAPRVSAERAAGLSTVPSASSILAAVQRRPAGGAGTLNMAMPGQSERSPGGLAASLEAAANVSTSAMLSIPSGGGPLVQATSNGGQTVPVVLPVTSLGLQYASMVPSFINPSLGNTSSAAVIAPPPSSKTRVTVHVNGRLKGGMALMVPDSLAEFFERARQKLQFEGKFARVFTRSGGEITNIDEMCPDDMLWMSTGEDFLTPR